MKRKKIDTIYIVPMSLEHRLALWVSLDLAHFLLNPKEFGIDHNLLFITSDKLQKHDGDDRSIDIEFSRPQLLTAFATLQCACLYLDGIWKHFDTPIMARIDTELKELDITIRNLKNTFSQIVSGIQKEMY